jgi:hypothetical protein
LSNRSRKKVREVRDGAAFMHRLARNLSRKCRRTNETGEPVQLERLRYAFGLARRGMRAAADGGRDWSGGAIRSREGVSFYANPAQSRSPCQGEPFGLTAFH